MASRNVKLAQSKPELPNSDFIELPSTYPCLFTRQMPVPTRTSAISSDVVMGSSRMIPPDSTPNKGVRKVKEASR